MPSRLYATALDLQDYAKQLVSSSELPRIIRRLVQASEPHLSYLNFPAGDSTTTGGWDGTVDGATGSGKVPAGSSRWELTKQVNSTAKAQSDYVKRAKEPHPGNKKDVTYIHVTLRKWRDKNTWAEDRMNDPDLPCPWKEVRAYDADDLEEWLEQHPAIHTWVSRLIGHRPTHVEDLEDTWSKWSRQTHPAFTPALLLAGRNEETKHVLKWLDEPPSVLVLQGDTRSEALVWEQLGQFLKDGFRGAPCCVKTQDHVLLFQIHGEGRFVTIPLGSPVFAAPGDTVYPFWHGNQGVKIKM